MRFAFVFTLLGLGSAFAQADLLTYNFNTDAQGWRRGDLDATHLTMTDVGAATWNAGGFIDADDFAAWSFHLSPLIQQNFSGATRIEFDYSSQFSDAPYPFLIINSTNGALFQVAQVPADNQWHHYSYDFTPGTWQFVDTSGTRVATATDIANTLADFRQFGVNADQQSGPEYTRLDNIVVVPEPMSMVAMGIGLAFLGRRRRK